MEFRHLEYFEAVARAGSVSQAAKVLGMTQPSLSAAISRLERDMGVQLLVRTSHGVTPTAAGRYLLAHGGLLVSARTRMERVLRLMGTGLAGELRVAAEPMVIHELLGDLMTEFTCRAPDVRLTLSDVSPRAVMEGVALGQFDVGCIPWGPDSVAASIADKFEWYPLARIEVKLAVPARRSREKHPGGRGWGRWILPERLPGLPGMVDAVEAELTGDPQFDVILVSTPQTAIPLVAAGLGVAPTTMRVWSQHPRVSVVDAPGWLRPMEVNLLLRKGAEMTPVLTRWLEVARDPRWRADLTAPTSVPRRHERVR